MHRYLCNGAASHDDNKAREGAKFEEFEGRIDSIFHLATPASIAKNFEAVVMGRHRWSDIAVCFFIVVVGEVVDCLYNIVGIRLKGYAKVRFFLQILYQLILFYDVMSKVNHAAGSQVTQTTDQQFNCFIYFIHTMAISKHFLLTL